MLRKNILFRKLKLQSGVDLDQDNKGGDFLRA